MTLTQKTENISTLPHFEEKNACLNEMRASGQAGKRASGQAGTPPSPDRTAQAVCFLGTVLRLYHANCILSSSSALWPGSTVIVPTWSFSSFMSFFCANSFYDMKGKDRYAL